MAGKRAFGTALAYETTTPGTYQAVANITNVKPYQLKADVVDVTSHDSPSDYREKLVGSLDAGQCQLDLNYDPAATTHIWFATEFAAKASHNYKITWPGGTKTATFAAYITGLSPEAPFDGKLTASVTLEITGPVTLT